MPSLDPWLLLESVRHFRVTIETAGSAGPVVSHVGTGQLVVETHAADDGSTLHWNEEGAWVSGPLAGIRFHNRTSWRRESGAPRLHLSHLRRGVDQPTFLATLIPGPDDAWVAETPHLCGPDLYIPSLEVQGGRLILTWDVRSPTDPYFRRFEAWGDAS